jgi:GMP synthase (glutamine-hydrolysing)
VGEYGQAQLHRAGDSQLLNGTPDEQTVWMSHRDAVSEVPAGFTVTASTDVCPVAAMEWPERRIYTTQFHPEVRHTPHGNDMLKNFLFGVCGLEPTWTMDNIVDQKVAEIRAQVGDNRVILALSGGVDSSVVAALCSRAIGKQLTCVFVNHGLLRKDEPEQVEEVFTKQFDVDFVHVHAEERYAKLLAGVTDPEEKRKRIGTEFWKVFFEEAQKLDGVKFLAQGTIYPDIIESGARKTGGKASTIKSHHNLIPFPEGVHFDLIEPLDHFFKDEVRALGTKLGLPDEVVYRQPFPGPGLAIRIIGDVTPEKLEILKNADAIVREELDAYNARLFEQTGERNSEHSCWQYFAVLPDIKSVGVMGDERTYARPIIVRAVESSDAMTADWAKLPYEVLAKVSGRIVAEVPGVNRVAYDITSKPPATIEWE